MKETWNQLSLKLNEKPPILNKDAEYKIIDNLTKQLGELKDKYQGKENYYRAEVMLYKKIKVKLEADGKKWIKENEELRHEMKQLKAIYKYLLSILQL